MKYVQSFAINYFELLEKMNEMLSVILATSCKLTLMDIRNLIQYRVFLNSLLSKHLWEPSNVTGTMAVTQDWGGKYY